MISFHNIISRYTFSLGREGVLPRVFGRTVPGTGAPKNGSLAQSALGLIVIVLYAVLGWDPLVQMFFYGGSAGGIGVLLLITVTSIAVIGYFARKPTGEDFWHRVGAPAVRAETGAPGHAGRFRERRRLVPGRHMLEDAAQWPAVECMAYDTMEVMRANSRAEIANCII